MIPLNSLEGRLESGPDRDLPVLIDQLAIALYKQIHAVRLKPRVNERMTRVHLTLHALDRSPHLRHRHAVHPAYRRQDMDLDDVEKREQLGMPGTGRNKERLGMLLTRIRAVRATMDPALQRAIGNAQVVGRVLNRIDGQLARIVLGRSLLHRLSVSHRSDNGESVVHSQRPLQTNASSSGRAITREA